MSKTDDLNQQKLSFVRESRKLLDYVQNPEWVESPELTDEDHVTAFRNALARTRAVHTELPELTKMQFVQNTSTGLVLSLVGNTPNAEHRARFITGILTSMSMILDEFERGMEAESSNARRITDLLTDANKQLDEVRSLRRTVESLQARERWLMEAISRQINDPEAFKDMPEVA